ncbi:intradiol ring-cleavage dioxygenase [Noviherbaspirillum sedimenti]|nr:intradiol ring-cleavage dioxygenase [Noviherbaspirillum sedimenti]
MNIGNGNARSKAGKALRSKARRQALGKLGALGAAGLFGFGTSRAAETDGSCTVIPEETQGPYLLRAILGNPAMVRKDIREGKAGIPLTLRLKVKNVSDGCRPIENAAVYIWHCDKGGSYSGYSSRENGNHADETFLRGIQMTDRNGEVNFTTIFPGWYPGRITHIHFQVYLNDNRAVAATATSQLAFPQNVTRAVYDTPLYRGRGQNRTLSDISEDAVFSEGASRQIAAVSGDPTQSLAAMLEVGIAG